MREIKRGDGKKMFSHTLKMAALCAGLMMASVAGAASVAAQTWPAQPIKVLIGFGTGRRGKSTG
jgi:tripartite-type tricarboxylate transporter receptor subunit TctC